MTPWPADLSRRAGDAGLRIATALWLPRFQTEIDLLPRPADQARQQAPGPDPVTLLLLGGGVTSSFGVRTQHLALPGALARAMRERTGRGALVDMHSERAMRVRAVLPRLDELRIGRYDAVVISAGGPDAAFVVPVEQWRNDLRALLTRVHLSLTPPASVLVLSIAPMIRSARTVDHVLDLVEAHARRLDVVSAEVAAEFPADAVRFVALQDVLDAAGEPHWSTATGYAAVAERLADLIAPRLPAPGTRPARDDDEDARLAALESSGLLAAQPTDRLVRLVRSAREMFGVRGVSLTLVGRDRLSIVTASGLDFGAGPPRSGTLISRVVHAEGMFELHDVPMSVSEVLPLLSARPTRFYAGLAIEAPTGYPVGALCLFDDRPRPPGSIDADVMRELVASVQAELWEAAAVAG